MTEKVGPDEPEQPWAQASPAGEGKTPHPQHTHRPGVKASAGQHHAPCLFLWVCLCPASVRLSGFPTQPLGGVGPPSPSSLSFLPLWLSGFLLQQGRE